MQLHSPVRCEPCGALAPLGEPRRMGHGLYPSFEARRRWRAPQDDGQRFLFTGLRFSMNAAMPSERSSSANVEWNRLRSTFMPSDSGVSNARLIASLAIAAAGRDIEAIFSAAASASS